MGEHVYLNENRYDKPKEAFKLLGKLILEKGHPAGSSLLDVGCATGELIYYLKKTLSQFGHFCGIDLSKNMIERARECIPGTEFRVASIFDEDFFKERQYDVVVCSAVLCFFDEIEKPLNNLLMSVRQGGQVLIFGPFNDDPVDVIMRYRRSEKPNAKWEPGFNIFSCVMVDRLLGSAPYKLEWVWHRFRMPFALARNTDDPVRIYTIKTEDDPYQQVSGTSQLINFKWLDIRILNPL